MLQGSLYCSHIYHPYYKAKLKLFHLYNSVALFMWMGVMGYVGNIWMSRNVDRLGAQRMVWMGICGMILSLLIWPFGNNFGCWLCCGDTLGDWWFCNKFSAASATGGFRAIIGKCSVVA